MVVHYHPVHYSGLGSFRARAWPHIWLCWDVAGLSLDLDNFGLPLPSRLLHIEIQIATPLDVTYPPLPYAMIFFLCSTLLYNRSKAIGLHDVQISCAYFMIF
jgi:hypothetical protein